MVNPPLFYIFVFQIFAKYQIIVIKSASGKFQKNLLYYEQPYTPNIHDAFYKGVFTMEKTHLLWAGRTEMPSGWQTQMHSDTFFHLFYLRKGNTLLVGNNAEYPLLPGDLIIFPPDALHGTDQSNLALGLFYELKFHVFDSDLLELFESGAPLWVQNVPQLNLVLERIVSLHYSDHPNKTDLIDTLLSAFLCLIDQRSFEPLCSFYFDSASYSPLIKKVIIYLERHYSDPYDLSALSAALGFNKSYLCSQFQKETGVVISTCLHYMRIRRVLSNLAMNRGNVNFNINMASQYAGFGSSSYFNRIFKKLTGLTPGQFLEAARESSNNPDEPLMQYYRDHIKDSENADRKVTVLNALKKLTRLGEHYSPPASPE